MQNTTTSMVCSLGSTPPWSVQTYHMTLCFAHRVGFMWYWRQVATTSFGRDNQLSQATSTPETQAGTQRTKPRADNLLNQPTQTGLTARQRMCKPLAGNGSSASHYTNINPNILIDVLSSKPDWWHVPRYTGWNCTWLVDYIDGCVGDSSFSRHEGGETPNSQSYVLVCNVSLRSTPLLTLPLPLTLTLTLTPSQS